MNPASAITLLIGGALIFFNVFFFIGIRNPTSGMMEYKDFVSILLTAVTVVIAVLAFGVAGLAIWGYREFMSRAEETAKNAATGAADAVARKVVTEYLDSERFKNILVDRIDRTRVNGADPFEEHIEKLGDIPMKPYTGDGQ